MPVESPLQVLTAMITPAVLISASGTLVFSTSNRLGRVIDRVRVLSDFFDGEASTREAISGAKRSLLLVQLSQLSKRVLLLQSALTAFYFAISLFVATSISVAVLTLVSDPYGWVAVTLGLLGASTLLYGSLLLIREARVAVDSVLSEMEYVRGVAERHRHGGGA